VNLAQALARIAELEAQVAYWRGLCGAADDSHRVNRVRQRLRLSPLEAKILLVLAGKPDQAIHRERIMAVLYDGPHPPDIKIIDVAICRMRSKIGPGVIVTVYDVGYQISDSGLAMVRGAIGEGMNGHGHMDTKDGADFGRHAGGGA
jgi:DNA-binding response OmpR family regulator